MGNTFSVAITRTPFAFCVQNAGEEMQQRERERRREIWERLLLRVVENHCPGKHRCSIIISKHFTVAPQSAPQFAVPLPDCRLLQFWLLLRRNPRIPTVHSIVEATWGSERFFISAHKVKDNQNICILPILYANTPCQSWAARRRVGWENTVYSSYLDTRLDFVGWDCFWGRFGGFASDFTFWVYTTEERHKKARQRVSPHPQPQTRGISTWTGTRTAGKWCDNRTWKCIGPWAQVGTTQRRSNKKKKEEALTGH